MSNSCMYKLLNINLFSIKRATLAILTILFSLPSQSLGQTNTINTNPELNSGINDSILRLKYDSIFVHFEYSNPDSVLYYTKQGLDYFICRNYKPGIAEMLTILAGVYSGEGMLDIAEKAGNEALQINQELNNKLWLANINDVLGVIEGRRGNYGKANKLFFAALKLYEEIKDTGGIVDAYIKLGTATANNNTLEKTLEYYKLGLNLVDKNKNSDLLIFLYNNIGDVYILKKDYPNAVEYLQKALKASEEPQYAQIRLLPLINMGSVYIKTGDTALGLYYTQQAFDLSIKAHLPENQVLILENIAEIKLGNNPRKAIELLDTALQIAERIGVKNLQYEILVKLIDIYKNQGNYQLAFTLLEKQKIIEDSINSADKQHTIANVEAIYGLDKLKAKVLQLELTDQKNLQRRNNILFIVVLLTVILLLALLFLWKTRRINRELSTSEMRLKKLSLVKNKLISIIAHDLIGSIRFMPLALRLSRDEQIAQDEKDGLLKQVEQNAIASYDTLQNMLDWGKAQIQGINIKRTTFNMQDELASVLNFTNVAANYKNITINNNIPSNLVAFADPNHFKFIIRNLISNAIKYTHRNGCIEINARQNNNEIVISVKDTGIGISKDLIPTIFDYPQTSVNGTEDEKGNGIGLKLCKDFVTENGGNIWVESEPNIGAAFYFSLKMKSNTSAA